MHELEKATKIGICGMSLENSQDLCNWEVEWSVMGGQTEDGATEDRGLDPQTKGFFQVL